MTPRNPPSTTRRIVPPPFAPRTPQAPSLANSANVAAARPTAPLMREVPATTAVPVLPYATPARPTRYTGYIRRNGFLLVTPVKADLPPLCVTCGAEVEDEKRLKRTFHWHPPHGF